MAPPPSDEPMMTGFMMDLFLTETRRQLGDEVIERARGSLSVEERDALDKATAVTWIPIRLTERWIEELAAAAGMTSAALRDRVVPSATRVGFGGVWRFLIRFTGPEALVRRAPKIYARGRNVGTLEVTEIGDGVATLELRGWPRVPEGQLQSVALSMQTIVRMTGRESALVTWRRAADGGTLSVRWAEVEP